MAHYDELVRQFSRWPDGTTWGELEERPGMGTAYCARPAGSGSVAPPSNFPGS